MTSARSLGCSSKLRARRATVGYAHAPFARARGSSAGTSTTRAPARSAKCSRSRLATAPSAAHGRGSLPVRIGEEPVQHAPEGAVASRDLEHFADLAGARVVEVPADEPRALANGACA